MKCTERPPSSNFQLWSVAARNQPQPSEPHQGNERSVVVQLLFATLSTSLPPTLSHSLPPSPPLAHSHTLANPHARTLFAFGQRRLLCFCEKLKKIVELPLKFNTEQFSGILQQDCSSTLIYSLLNLSFMSMLCEG